MLCDCNDGEFPARVLLRICIAILNRVLCLQEKLNTAQGRIVQLEKELAAARARIVPTSMADMVEMTPRMAVRYVAK